MREEVFTMCPAVRNGYFKLIERIDNNYDGLTEKTSSWHFLKKILEDT